MTKRTFSAAARLIGAAVVLAAPAWAGVLYATASTPEFQSADSYDFSGAGNFPPTTYQNIGTFTFTPVPAGDVSIFGITISGSFGNLDFNTITALSDYYLGDSLGDGEEAVEVAACDSVSLNCYSGQEGPYGWSLTLDAAQIAALANGLEAGSIDFGYTWDQSTPPVSDPAFGDSNGFDLQFIEAGPATLDVNTPEPATVLFGFCGIAGIAGLRRFRKA